MGLGGAHHKGGGQVIKGGPIFPGEGGGIVDPSRKHWSE